MCPREQHEICKNEFLSLNHKIDRLDEAVRGNGKPGIQLRLSRLETVDAVRSKALWIIATATVTLAVGALWKLFFGGA